MNKEEKQGRFGEMRAWERESTEGFASLILRYLSSSGCLRMLLRMVRSICRDARQPLWKIHGFGF